MTGSANIIAKYTSAAQEDLTPSIIDVNTNGTLIPFETTISNSINSPDFTTFTVMQPDLYYITYQLILSSPQSLNSHIYINNIANTTVQVPSNVSVWTDAAIFHLNAGDTVAVQVTGYTGQIGLLIGTYLIVFGLNDPNTNA